jgi:hypothetical protein
MQKDIVYIYSLSHPITQTVQECCQVYYDIVGIQCFMADGSVIKKQPLI